MILKEINDDKVIEVPKFVIDGCAYLVKMGSEAYGVSTNKSDIDVYGFTVPPLDMVYPERAGYIPEFGTQPELFKQFQIDHVLYNDNEYDFTVYNIVKFFEILRTGNPNIVETLFVPDRCVIYTSEIAEYVRSVRKMFLTKQYLYKTISYAVTQFNKIKTKNSNNEKRQILIQKFGYDTKFAYHCCRCILQAEYVVKHNDLNLEVNAEFLIKVRQGIFTFAQLDDWKNEKLSYYDNMVKESSLPETTDEAVVKDILLKCLGQIPIR